MMSDLLKMFDEQWREMRVSLRSLRDDVGRVSRQERAEVAGSVPIYPTVAGLPDPGQFGRLAAVSADGALYMDTGSSWSAVGGSAASAPPTGSITTFAGSAAPAGWLLCYGQAISRTTYAELFSVVGTTYGAGDGSTTFNLPDMRGRSVIGRDNMGGTSANRVTSAQADTLGGSDGEETHTLNITEMPAHTHTLSDGKSVFVNNHPSTSNLLMVIDGYTGGWWNQWGNPNTDSKGGGAAHNNMPPYLTLNHIIKV